MLATAIVNVAGRGQSMWEMIQKANYNLLIVIKQMRAGQHGLQPGRVLSGGVEEELVKAKESE